MPDGSGEECPDLAAQIAEVKREIRIRQRIYPRRVATGAMTQANADRQIAAMRAVLRTLQDAPSG